MIDIANNFGFEVDCPIKSNSTNVNSILSDYSFSFNENRIELNAGKIDSKHEEEATNSYRKVGRRINESYLVDALPC